MLKKVILTCKESDLEDIEMMSQNIISIEEIPGVSGDINIEDYFGTYISKYVHGPANVYDKQISSIEIVVVDCLNPLYVTARLDLRAIVCCGKRISADPDDSDYDEDFERIRFDPEISFLAEEILDYDDASKLKAEDIFDAESMHNCGNKIKISYTKSLADSYESEFMERIIALDISQEDLEITNYKK